MGRGWQALVSRPSTHHVTMMSSRSYSEWGQCSGVLRLPLGSEHGQPRDNTRPPTPPGTRLSVFWGHPWDPSFLRLTPITCGFNRRAERTLTLLMTPRQSVVFWGTGAPCTPKIGV